MSEIVAEDMLRAELVQTSRRIYDRVLVRGSGGNVSARLSERHMLITPSGVTLGDTTVDNIVKVDLSNCEWVSQEPYVPSKEFRFHSAIYAARKDVNAIVHCHPPYATTYAVWKTDIPYVTDAAFKQPPMPHISFSPSGSEELVRKVAAVAHADSSFRVIMLDEHGIIAVGKDLMQAYVFADLAEEMAQIAYLSSSFSG